MNNRLFLQDILTKLVDAKQVNDEAFIRIFMELELNDRVQVITEIPEIFKRELCINLDTRSLAKIFNSLRTDDATDFMIILKEENEAKWLNTISLMDSKVIKAVKSLMDYSPEESGSLMELELFTVTKKETISQSLKNLKKSLNNSTLKNVNAIFLVDKEHRLIDIFSLDKIATENHSLTYGELNNHNSPPISIHSRSSVYEAARLMTRYNLNVLAVINKHGRLLGRITHDDILEYVQDESTKQMYGLAQIHQDEEIEEGFWQTGKDRAIWLTINIINVSIISIIIGMFEKTIQEVVALAVLMPIVANMAGTSSMQTLTVIVRQMALGNIQAGVYSKALQKELKIALLNGIIFGFLAAVISYVRFSSLAISEVMFVSMFVSFIVSGVLGAYVPLGLKALKIDPAIASSVIVLTLIDVTGFFSFLWIATLWLPELN